MDAAPVSGFPKKKSRNTDNWTRRAVSARPGTARWFGLIISRINISSGYLWRRPRVALLKCYYFYESVCPVNVKCRVAPTSRVQKGIKQKYCLKESNSRAWRGLHPVPSVAANMGLVPRGCTGSYRQINTRGLGRLAHGRLFSQISMKK
ncbi:hypothetical protein E2C01_011098 [Portunus trituberculatus]|uniref:Uncharacterized protein n=1 Tax=Portunus trituberculatus TaxID=210409 RepID=A0A5B7DA73_PORTR|nr:hypothetical protein [Portunus trituberculatus]